MKAVETFKRKVSKVFRWIVPARYGNLVLLDKVYNGKDPTDVLALGDSVMERVSKNDIDKRDLGRMISDGLAPCLSATVISGAGYHPTVFRSIVLAISTMKHLPKVIVYPINMRCFSPQWDFNPNWQYAREIAALGMYVESGGKIARIRPTRNPEMITYKETFVSYPSSRYWCVGDFVDEIDRVQTTECGKAMRKAMIFAFHYTHPLVSWHGKVEDIVESIGMAKKLGIKVVLYTTPINMSAGISFLGRAFEQIVVRNVVVLKDALAPSIDGKDVAFFDWSDMFESWAFFSVDHATEHLNQHGRAGLSATVSKKIKGMI